MYLAIDIGTTHIKAMAFDENGTLRALEKLENGLNEKGCYQAQEVFRRVAAVVKACGIHEPQSISLTGMADSGLLVDENAEPITEVLPWSDNTGSCYGEEVLKAYSLKELYRTTGQTLHPKFALMRLIHYRETQRADFEKAAYWLSLQDYVLFRLTGEMKTDESLASRTMLFNIGTRTWHGELSEFCGIGQRLPKVIKTGGQAGEITVEGAMATGIKAGCPVYLCGHDHPCALFGINQLLGSTMIDSMGTSEVFAGIINKRLTEEAALKGINHGCFWDGQYYWMANLPSSGASLAWLKSLCGQREYSFFTDNQTGDAGGVTYYPFINGSGVPQPDPDRRGAFLGLSSKTTIHQMAHAMYEGIAFEARRVFEAYEELTGQKVSRIAAVGGSTRNHAMMTRRADITGMQVDVLNVSELTALGAVLMAARSRGERITIQPRWETILPKTGLQAQILYNYNAYKAVCGILYGNKC